MNDATKPAPVGDATASAPAQRSVSASMGTRLRRAGHDWAKDAISGLVSSTVLIANIVSFGALMFPGELAGGIHWAIWAMLVGSCVAGVWIAAATSLPPIATGIDSPTGAVLVLLSATAGSRVVASGGTPEAAIQTVMLLFTAATFLSGAVFYVLGVCRWGRHLRFVPYFVVGGFLAATGWFLIAGGLKMTLGRTLTFASLAGIDWTVASTAKLIAAVAVLALLIALRGATKSAFALPASLLLLCGAAAVILHSLDLSGPQHGWYLPSLGRLTPWLPFEAVRETHLRSMTMVGLLPELIAVCIVALISLVTKVSSLEVARQTHGDLDREFRLHGIGNLIAAPLGGLASGLQIGSSRLLQHAGAATRMSGVMCSLVLGAVALVHLNLLAVVPIPVVAGLVFYLGYTFIADALSRPYAQRAWLDLLLAIVIMAVCIGYGYLVGVLVGLVLACIMFAVSYARLGVVSRHLTRAVFASYVDRSESVLEQLRASGDAIQLYWLSGYIFFGSSESVFERIRTDIQSLAPRRVAYVILDFSRASGADSSAIASLAKLRNFCDRQGTTVVYSALSTATHSALERGGFFAGKRPHQAFPDVNVALAACEDNLLAQSGFDPRFAVPGFEPWLQDRLGPNVRAADLVAYLEEKHIEGPQVLYREGEPADTVDIVAAGSLAVDIATNTGIRRVRRITTHTVLGEMGFFRRSVRSATVSSDGPATVFTLTRANFERMQREQPDLASAFAQFIIRVLADRLDATNRTITALSE